MEQAKWCRGVVSLFFLIRADVSVPRKHKNVAFVLLIYLMCLNQSVSSCLWYDQTLWLSTDTLLLFSQINILEAAALQIMIVFKVTDF